MTLNSRNCIAAEDDVCTPDNPSLIETFNSFVGQTSGNIVLNDNLIFLDPTAHSSCLGEDAVFFVQFTCIQSETQLDYKYTHLSFAVGVGSLICFLFTVSIRYLYQGGKIQ